MSRMHVTTTVNDDKVEFLCDSEETLLDALRDHLGADRLQGGLCIRRKRCLFGDAGRPAGLLLPGACRETSGRKVETIEGMANGDDLHPLQQKFLELGALQCGICTPGFLVAGKDLLERNPDPSETDVRYWLAGNLCRCTGYDKIIRAVMETAADMRGA